MRDAHVPVIMALNTRDEMSPRLEGHIEALRGEKRKILVSRLLRVVFFFNYLPEKS